MEVRNKRLTASTAESRRSTSENIDQRLTRARRHSKNLHKGKRSTRRNTPCTESCTLHRFELKPIPGHGMGYKGPGQHTSVNFCARGKSRTLPLPVIAQELTYHPQIPLFILEDSVRKYQQNSESYRDYFFEAAEKAAKESQSYAEEQFYVPVPKSKNCQVCKVKIDNVADYFQHIASPEHKAAVRKSMGNRIIKQEIDRFQLRRKVQAKIQEEMAQIRQMVAIVGETKRALKGLLRRRAPAYLKQRISMH